MADCAVGVNYIFVNERDNKWNIWLCGPGSLNSLLQDIYFRTLKAHFYTNSFTFNLTQLTYNQALALAYALIETTVFLTWNGDRLVWD